jgi:chromosome segregation ATPase
MSEQYNIIYNDEELNNNQNKENITKTTLQMSEELSDNLKTMNLDNQNNEEEKQKLKPFNPQKDIKILKEKYKENNENECKVNNEKEDLERNLKSYMIANKSKEDKILDLLEIINQYEIQISLLNKQIISLTNSNKQMKGIIKNIEYGYEQTKVNLMTEKEVNKNNNTYMNNLYQDKILSEERIKELINIINQYSAEIDSITNTLNILKNENLKYKKENEEYKNNILKLTEKANTLEYDMNTIKNDNTKLYEEVCRLKEDNEKLCELQ